ncbi:MAG: multidrug ABC transporter ATP-binding protein, partial [Planctomycetales bacterium]
VDDSEGAAKLMEQHAAVNSVDVTEDSIQVTLSEESDDYSDLPTLLIENGFKLTLFKEDHLDLESAFMYLTKGITT